MNCSTLVLTQIQLYPVVAKLVYLYISMHGFCHNDLWLTPLTRVSTQLHWLSLYSTPMSTLLCWLLDSTGSTLLHWLYTPLTTQLHWLLDSTDSTLLRWLLSSSDSTRSKSINLMSDLISLGLDLTPWCKKIRAVQLDSFLDLLFVFLISLNLLHLFFFIRSSSLMNSYW